MDITYDPMDKANKLVNKLVKNEKKKGKKYETAEQRYKKKTKAWYAIRKAMRNLVRASRNLTSPVRSPFDKKKVENGDNPYFRVRPVNKYAKTAQHRMEILKLAKAHKIQSDSLSQKQQREKLPAAGFTIYLGEKKKKITFNGGTVDELAERINQEAKDLVSMNKMDVGYGDIRLIITGEKEGRKNRIRIEGGETLFGPLGLAGKTVSGDQAADPLVSRKNFQDYLFEDTENLQNFAFERTQNGFVITLGEQTGKKLVFKPHLKAGEDGSVSVSYQLSPGDNGLTRLGLYPLEKGKIHTSGMVKLGKPGQYGFGIVGRDAQGKPVRKQFRLDPQNANQWLDKKISLTDLSMVKIENLYFFNTGSGTLKFKNLDLPREKKTGVDPIQKFKNTITEPSDLVMKVNDIKIRRAKNKGNENILPGLSISAKQKTNVPQDFSVANDPEAAVSAIELFLSAYNNTISTMNIAHKEPEDEIEDEKLKEIAGVLNSERDVMRMKYHLQRILINRYDTSQGEKLALLTQLGIGYAKLGTGYVKGAFTGEVKWIDSDTDPKKAKERLVNALEQYPQAVKELFNNDSNQDGLTDSGIAYLIRDRAREFSKGVTDGQPTRADGPIVLRIDGLAQSMKRNNKARKQFEKRLGRKEQEWKRKIGGAFSKAEQMRKRHKRASQQLGGN
jgi:flagellar capping protein FliD